MEGNESWKVLETSAMTSDQFWKAVEIWNKNPHVVNRRVSSSVEIFEGLTCNDSGHILETLLDINYENTNPDKLLEILKYKCSPMEKTHKIESEKKILVKQLLPKNSSIYHVTYEIAVFDHQKSQVTFQGVKPSSGLSLAPNFPYRLSYKEANLLLEVPASCTKVDSSCLWLQKNLMPRLTKWALSDNLSKNSASLSLVSLVEYNETYQSLKGKYGPEMVKIWPECTDPAKFVYEDVAIATYLLLLWDSKHPVSFVDLGCGNGLLVHILNSEGHNGLGVDVRRRKIWDLYPPTTKLETRTIVPSDNSLFPEADWIIGNHSDELTPWIPVIAARSSLKCNFFVLPCCAYDFDGSKYRRQQSSSSQYTDFLEYVKYISEICGFTVNVDRLRIPSTKRICIIGDKRNFMPNEWIRINGNISELITSRSQQNRQEDSACEESVESKVKNEWANDFKPREAVERVRNCTRIEQDIIQDIVTKTADHLLAKRRLVPSHKSQGKMWNIGGIAKLGEIVSLVGEDKLKKLKSECGGLQTLLRNNHQIFLVAQGKVQIRTPISVTEASDKARVKSKPCWFHMNHPDGCLLSDELCSFKH